MGRVNVLIPTTPKRSRQQQKQGKRRDQTVALVMIEPGVWQEHHSEHDEVLAAMGTSTLILLESEEEHADYSRGKATEEIKNLLNAMEEDTQNPMFEHYAVKTVRVGGTNLEAFGFEGVGEDGNENYLYLYEARRQVSPKTSQSFRPSFDQLTEIMRLRPVIHMPIQCIKPLFLDADYYEWFCQRADRKAVLGTHIILSRECMGGIVQLERDPQRAKRLVANRIRYLKQWAADAKVRRELKLKGGTLKTVQIWKPNRIWAYAGNPIAQACQRYLEHYWEDTRWSNPGGNSGQKNRGGIVVKTVHYNAPKTNRWAVAMSHIDLCRAVIGPTRCGHNWVFDVLSRDQYQRNDVLGTIIPKRCSVDVDSKKRPMLEHVNGQISVEPDLAVGRWIMLEMARHAYFSVMTEIDKAVKAHEKPKEQDKHTAIDVFPEEAVEFFEWLSRIIFGALYRRIRKYPEIQDYRVKLQAYRAKYITESSKKKGKTQLELAEDVANMP